jgi:hypothetical protein
MDHETYYLRNALYNLAPDSGASEDYCRGLVAGVVCTLVAQGLGFPEACKIVQKHLPTNFRPGGIPECWKDNLLGTEVKLDLG